MARQYTKMEELSEAVFARKEAGETNREIAQKLRIKQRTDKKIGKQTKQKSKKDRLGIYPKEERASSKRSCNRRSKDKK